MRNSTDSRARMVDAAIDLMRASGLSGAGINEIVRASKAPKGSVYHFFPAGKQQIVAESLEIYSGRVMTFLEQSLSFDGSPGERVRRLFEAFARRVEEARFQRSCAFGAVCLDLDASLDEMRGVIEAAFDDWRGLIAAYVDLGDARRTRSFAGLILTTIEGAYIRARAERSGQPFREAGEWLAALAEVKGR